jgi:hypothetical protein
MIESTYGNWDVQASLPTSFDFKLDVDIPAPRKERIIVKRDNKGRIVNSKPPEMLDNLD